MNAKKITGNRLHKILDGKSCIRLGCKEKEKNPRICILMPYLTILSEIAVDALVHRMGRKAATSSFKIYQISETVSLIHSFWRVMSLQRSPGLFTNIVCLCFDFLYF